MATNSNLTIINDGFNNTYLASYKNNIIHCKHWQFVDFNVDNITNNKTTCNHYTKALDLMLQQGFYSSNHYQILIRLYKKLKSYILKLQKKQLDKKEYDNAINSFIEKLGMIFYHDNFNNSIASYILIN